MFTRNVRLKQLACIAQTAMWLSVMFHPVSSANAQAVEKDDKAAKAFTHLADGGLGSSATEEELSRESILITQRSMAVWQVDAAPEPQPAMRYRFWPTADSLQGGSGQAMLLKVMVEISTRQDARKEIDEYFNGSLSLPEEVDSARKLLKSLDYQISLLRTMAFCRDMQWEGGPWRSRVDGPDVYLFQLGEIQESRLIARLLQLKARVHLIDRDFDAACDTILIGFRLSYLIGQGDNVIQNLVSVAISAMMRALIEEMIQTPGSPNLYWALLSVPTPLVSMREPFEQELAAILRVFPDLARARSAGWTEEEARERWTRAVTDLAKASNDRVSSLSGLGVLQGLDTSLYLELARSRLLAAGVTEEELSKLAPSSIVMTDTSMELQRRSDELMKSTLLPGKARRTYLLAHSLGSNESVRQVQSERTTSGASLFLSVLSPNFPQAKTAEDRQPTMLRRLATLEAVRMHVATHHGAVPLTLDELSPVPALEAFDTETPFEYRIENAGEQPTLVLSGEIAGYEAARHLRFQFRKRDK